MMEGHTAIHHITGRVWTLSRFFTRVKHAKRNGWEGFYLSEEDVPMVDQIKESASKKLEPAKECLCGDRITTNVWTRNKCRKCKTSVPTSLCVFHNQAIEYQTGYVRTHR